MLELLLSIITNAVTPFPSQQKKRKNALEQSLAYHAGVLLFFFVVTVSPA